MERNRIMDMDADWAARFERLLDGMGFRPGLEKMKLFGDDPHLTDEMAAAEPYRLAAAAAWRAVIDEELLPDEWFDVLTADGESAVDVLARVVGVTVVAQRRRWVEDRLPVAQALATPALADEVRRQMESDADQIALWAAGMVRVDLDVPSGTPVMGELRELIEVCLGEEAGTRVFPGLMPDMESLCRAGDRQVNLIAGLGADVYLDDDARDMRRTELADEIAQAWADQVYFLPNMTWSIVWDAIRMVGLVEIPRVPRLAPAEVYTRRALDRWMEGLPLIHSGRFAEFGVFV